MDIGFYKDGETWKFINDYGGSETYPPGSCRMYYNGSVVSVRRISEEFNFINHVEVTSILKSASAGDYYASAAEFEAAIQTFISPTSGTLTIGGDIAHDEVDAGNPTKIGGYAVDAKQADVSIGDRVRAVFKRSGEIITAGYDYGLDNLKVIIQNPIWKRYTSSEVITTATDIGTVDDTWVDQGTEIDVKGYDNCIIWVKYTDNDSTGGQLQILTKEEFGSTDEYRAENAAIYQKTLIPDDNTWYPFTVSNTIPYIQVQTKATVVGATEGTVSLKITKGY